MHVHRVYSRKWGTARLCSVGKLHRIANGVPVGANPVNSELIFARSLQYASANILNFYSQPSLNHKLPHQQLLVRSICHYRVAFGFLVIPLDKLSYSNEHFVVYITASTINDNL